MSVSVVILERRSQTGGFETFQSQTKLWFTGAVVDFSVGFLVSKHPPRCEHSLSEIATFGHDPVSDVETGPGEVREVMLCNVM